MTSTHSVSGLTSSDSWCSAQSKKPEPPRVRPESALSAKMSSLARRDTAPEMVLRRELHRRGLRFRVRLRVPGNNRRRIDIAFPRARLAVYVDGCFWHGCPEHHILPEGQPRLVDVEDHSTERGSRHRPASPTRWSSESLRLWERGVCRDAADRVKKSKYSGRIATVD